MAVFSVDGTAKNLGMGAMIALMSGGGDTPRALEEAYGKTIADVRMEEGDSGFYGHEDEDTYAGLEFAFDDETALRVWDAGQSCCESRFMTTEDDLGLYAGADLLSIEVRDVQENDLHGEVQEIAFLVVKTSKGEFTVKTYNEHNGYYGGFVIQAMWLAE